MADLSDGETARIKGSGSAVYILKNSGGVYSCTCPAWMHQSIAIERRTGKHLRRYRGEAEEDARTGSPGPVREARSAAGADEGEEAGKSPPLLLAHKWEPDIEITGYWLSEKLDGVRAYWDGTQFLSRLGNKFYPPPWFVEGFPNHPLDGELWGGRKLFQRTVGIVKRQDQSPLWKDLLFVVFDAPAHAGTFEERIAFAEKSVAGVTYARIHEHYPCKGIGHLREELERVEKLGGEGLMARKPGSAYEAGRSSSLLKVKTFHDAEARVLEHIAGAGRHKGRLGALLVTLADGTRFSVGTGFSDQEREDPPPIGSIITFRYQELSDGGVPRFPSFVGVRIDANAPSILTREPVKKLEAIHVQQGSKAMARYEFREGNSSKFWEITLDGASFTTTYGKLGTEGQMSLKEWDSEERAKKEYDKLVAEKVKKGYVLVSGEVARDIEEEAEAPEPKEAAAKPAPAPVVVSAAPRSAGAGARYFEFVDGKSSKFWEIALEGTSFTTRYGRIGTEGQQSLKEYDSDSKALAEYEKLVAEKVKKGYVEK